MKQFDEVLWLWCEENNISYTRYSDDMTFSGEFNPREVIVKVRKMLYKLGLELNNKKIHIIHKSSNQNVTGIVVNEKVQVSAKYRKEIRQEIYYIRKFGLESHLKKRNIDIGKEKYINILYGKILYVLQINNKDNEFNEYKKFMNNFKNKFQVIIFCGSIAFCIYPLKPVVLRGITQPKVYVMKYLCDIIYVKE